MSAGDSHILFFSLDAAKAESVAKSLGLLGENTAIFTTADQAVQALASGEYGLYIVCLSDEPEMAPGVLDRVIGAAPEGTSLYLLGLASVEGSQVVWPGGPAKNSEDAPQPTLSPADDAQLYERLLRAESRRTLSNLTRGIAYHLNNALSPILANAQVLLQDSLDLQSRAMVQEIVDQSTQATGLIKRLEELSMTSSGEKSEPVDLNALLRSIVEASDFWWREELERQGRSIEVTLALNPLPLILGDMAGLREALLQLLSNAIEAIPESGHVSLKTDIAGGQVRILFMDDGVGVPDNLQALMFQPFVTTKGPQKIGLGLSVVESILASHGGSVEVFSQENAGTTVVVSFPISSREQLRQAIASPSPHPVTLALPSRDVLVIEAEDPVRELLSRVLTEEGQSVTAISDGQRGLAAFLRKRHDVVFTDWGPDGVSGLQVAQKIKEASPLTRVILLTGLGSQVDEAQAIHWSVDGFLAKPFTGAQLRARLPALLGPKA